jgi:hypothetical protein
MICVLSAIITAKTKTSCRHCLVLWRFQATISRPPSAPSRRPRYKSCWRASAYDATQQCPVAEPKSLRSLPPLVRRRDARTPLSITLAKIDPLADRADAASGTRRVPAGRSPAQRRSRQAASGRPGPDLFLEVMCAPCGDIASQLGEEREGGREGERESRSPRRCV